MKSNDRTSEEYFDDLKIHLFHELRTLLGAAKMANLGEELQMGNPVNYFKDSAFLHARELYYFFFKEPGENDYSIRKIETVEVFGSISSVLWKKIQKPLNKYIFHLTHSRTNRDVSNKIGGRHINLLVENIRDDIVNVWVQWLEITQNPEIQQWLTESLDKAKSQAQDDYCISLAKIKAWV